MLADNFAVFAIARNPLLRAKLTNKGFAADGLTTGSHAGHSPG